MENFSTHRVALLPRAANLATLAVVVAATWWSGAQRPADGAALGTLAATSAETAATTAARQPANPATADGASHWPVQTTSLPRDGLQAVGYQARATR